MAKLPFSKVEKILTHRYTTGGHPSGAPGQTTPAPGTVVPNSVLQDAEPDEVLRVIRQPRRCAIVVTPFHAEDPQKANLANRYALRAVRDSLSRQESPLASHVMYYDLNIRNPIERDIGLHGQLSWIKNADVVAVYVDLGITPAMQVVINTAMLRNKRIEYRTINAFA